MGVYLNSWYFTKQKFCWRYDFLTYYWLKKKNFVNFPNALLLINITLLLGTLNVRQKTKSNLCTHYPVSLFVYTLHTHLWPFSNCKLNLKSDRVNLVAPAMSYWVSGFIYPMSEAIQYKLGPETLTRLGNSNVLQLPVYSTLGCFNHTLPKGTIV